MLLQSDLTGVPLFVRGKVRDMYDLGDKLLMVATDRISAFDVVLPQPIPDKGKVLTQLSAFWFGRTADIIPNHMLTADVAEFPSALAPFREQLAGRAMLVRKAKRFDVECVVRGYLSGSAWAEYAAKGTVCGDRMPAGLVESDRLPEPIFTPAIKADSGHDENISYAHMKSLIGEEQGRLLHDASLAIYTFARDYAAARGVIIADTKFEFGLLDGKLIVIDEMLTPDSSRFWDARLYQPGRSQPSFDKQPVRDYLESTGWNKQPPAPPLPDEVVSNTTARYREAYRLLVGHELSY